MGRAWSKPTQTPPQKLGVKPQNQALVLSLVVPVLPAPVLVKPRQRALTPVPSMQGRLQQVGHHVGLGRIQGLALLDPHLEEDLARRRFRPA